MGSCLSLTSPDHDTSSPRRLHSNLSRKSSMKKKESMSAVTPRTEAKLKYELKETQDSSSKKASKDHQPESLQQFNFAHGITDSDVVRNMFFGFNQYDKQGKIIQFKPEKNAFVTVQGPSNFDINAKSKVLIHSNETILISGGIQADSHIISNELIEYNIYTNTIEQLPSFHYHRHSHAATIFNNCLYIVGGTTSTSGVECKATCSCEKFDFATRKWENIGDLNEARSGGELISYEGKLYLLGGELTNGKLTKKIERYNPFTDAWVKVSDFFMPVKVKDFTIANVTDDVVYIQGGIDNLGKKSSGVYLIDLKERGYVQKPSMSRGRAGHSIIKTNEQLLVFGGEDSTTNTIEIYDIQKESWTINDTSNLGMIMKDSRFFSIAMPSMAINSNPMRQKEDKEYHESLGKQKKCFMFGDNICPFIIETNFSEGFISEKPIPTSLKLRSYQGASKMTAGYFIVAGGIDKNKKKVSKSSYMYFCGSNEAERIDDMKVARYDFNLVSTGEYAYAIGGKTLNQVPGSNNETSVEILKKCERFDCSTKRWVAIPDLNKARAHAMALVIKNKMYVLGGSNENGSEVYSEIEVLSAEAWQVIKVDLKLPLYGAGLILGPTRRTAYLISGHDGNKASDVIYEFDLDQGDMWMFGYLKEPKFKPMIYEYDTSKICVFGGEKHKIELFDLREGKEIEQRFVDNAEMILQDIVSRTPESDKTLGCYCLA